MTMKHVPTAATGLLIGALLLLSTEASAQLNQNGLVKKFTSQDEVSNFLCTGGVGTPVTIADRTFTQGGPNTNEVLVTFSGVFISGGAGADEAVLRVLVGNTVQDHSGGGVTIYTNDDDAREAHSYTFITDPPGIPPGTNRRIRIQMSSNLTAGGTCVDQRALVILHQ
ncbi:MAG: hypothetical protein H0V09_05840 [Gemmatimonadetes bacterium]|nr:hypothetical protein [Gemmatimonadota bacterium]